MALFIFSLSWKVHTSRGLPITGVIGQLYVTGCGQQIQRGQHVDSQPVHPQGKETHCARGRGDSACHTVSGHPNWRSVVGPMVSKALGSHRHREKLDHTICLISQDCLLLLVPLRVEVTSSQHHTRLSMCCSLPASQSCPLTSPLPPNPPPLLQPHRPAGSSHSGRQPQDPRMCYFLQSYAWLSPSPPSHLCYMFPIFKET